ncbi:MAG: hypothetical protein RLY57_406 [Candidatus Parcubacteria bacterium]|jgi:hypothetical protein
MHILIIEGNGAVIECYQERLSGLCEMSFANSILTAEQEIGSGKPFDAIFIPGRLGADQYNTGQLVRLAKSNYPHAHILTTSISTETQVAMQTLGCTAVVMKYNIVRFLEGIQQMQPATV